MSRVLSIGGRLKPVLVLVTVVLMIATVGLVTGCIVQDVSVNNDVNAWLYRAQVAADVEDIMLYLDRAERGLDERDMRSGHSGLFIKNSTNDFVLIRQNIDRIQERAGQLSQTPKEQRGGDAAYQQGLDDLRGTLSELSVPAQGYYWRHDGLGYIILAWIVGTLFVIVLVATGIILIPW